MIREVSTECAYTRLKMEQYFWQAIWRSGIMHAWKTFLLGNVWTLTGCSSWFTLMNFVFLKGIPLLHINVFLLHVVELVTKFLCGYFFYAVPLLKGCRDLTGSFFLKPIIQVFPIIYFILIHFPIIIFCLLWFVSFLLDYKIYNQTCNWVKS